jgi:ribonuclease HI
MYTLRFDGMLHTSGSEPMPLSLLGYGWVIERNGVEIARGFGLFLRQRKTGSNIAEYLALIEGLETLLDLRVNRERVEIRGDAKCVIDQMTGYAKVSSSLTRKLNQRAQKLARSLPSIRWVWVPRHENRHADRLSRRSFRYLRYSPQLDREINKSRLSASYSGRFVSLVDLRVHTPVVKVEHHYEPFTFDQIHSSQVARNGAR